MEKAITIAVKYHKNQRDSEGMPKVLHPINVMFNMETEEEMVADILHDVIEDTEYTLKELSLDKFSNKILFAIDCITPRHGEPYKEYIERVKESEISIKVKIADLENNMDLRRMDNLSGELMFSFVKKYNPVWNQLLETKKKSDKAQEYCNIR